MNPATTNAAPLTPATTQSPGFYRRLVLGMLERMDRGFLRVELPDGTERTFGRPEATVRAHVRIRSENFFTRCVLHGDIGFGEAYVDGEWDTADITEVIRWFILNVENNPAMSGARATKWLINLLGWENRLRHLLRPNSLRTSPRNITEHYDLGNDFYRLFLDPTMTYSSAWFQSPDQTLETAQTAKYERLCQQLRLQPGDHVLEIGGGWGGFGRHAVKHHGIRLTTVTISPAQLEYARAAFAREGLADRAEVRLQDYRQLTGQFDKIVSIEMLEAVGDAYLETYFAKCHELLKPQGLLGLQMITCPDSRHAELRRGVDWIQKHIFPGSLLLSVHRVNEALRATGDLFLHDLFDLGLSYAETLRRWRVEFNRQEAAVRALNFDSRFIRKWNYYLSYCEAAFAMRNISVVQAIYTRPNNPTLQRP
jgi:cyclopropane-fatty-acyl-phospholipid synthase